MLPLVIDGTTTFEALEHEFEDEMAFQVALKIDKTIPLFVSLIHYDHPLLYAWRIFDLLII
jgi:hypothetical protein